MILELKEASAGFLSYSQISPDFEGGQTLLETLYSHL